MASIIFSNLICSEGDELLLKQLRRELEGQQNYVLWLQGEMGAGKTSLVRHYLYSLGLSSQTPVVSPTYTIMNEYKVANNWFAHLDLYRADSRFSLDELGVRDVRDYHGIFIEWPLQGGESETISPTHVLKIESTPNLTQRCYTLERVV
jgi:tRNA threonylcarbamoyladenosine biosynthesis protein TsaE